MSLTIRDPRAAALARELAARRGVSTTAAVVEALERALEGEKEKRPLPERLAALAARARAMAGPAPRAVTEEERDEMWNVMRKGDNREDGDQRFASVE